MKCLIVDDDPLICDVFKHYCQKINDIKSVSIASSGFEAVNLLQSTRFDLVFLDYNLPDLTGKDILETIPHYTSVMMVTSQKDFASESYNYDQIVDYLVKPVDFSRFFKGFQKVKSKQLNQSPSTGESRLFIKDGNKLVKINLDEVYYFKSEANYISVVMLDRNILTLMTLKDLEAKLPQNFQKVHRSYIVNLNRIDTIDKDGLEIGKSQIPISQRYEKTLLQKINLLN